MHGHIHECRGWMKIGKTQCMNPGSEYTEGILSCYLIELDGDKIKRLQRVEGWLSVISATSVYKTRKPPNSRRLRCEYGNSNKSQNYGADNDSNDTRMLMKQLSHIHVSSNAPISRVHINSTNADHFRRRSVSSAVGRLLGDSAAFGSPYWLPIG